MTSILDNRNNTMLDSLSNPGGFRIDVEAATSGGVSDPRNSTLIKMFNLIDVGERAGSGIPNIFIFYCSNNTKKMNLRKRRCIYAA